MAVDAIGGAVGVGSDGAAAASSVTQDDFLRLFLTQLSFQDPLEPVDNREFLAQLAQFSTVEQIRQNNENIEGLLNVDATSQALGLLGRVVEVSSDAGAVVGTVTTVSMSTGVPLLTILGDDGGTFDSVSPSRITIVRSGAGS